MKNIQLILLIVVGLISCKTQQPVIIEVDPNNGLEPGSCYFSIFQNEGANKESPFVLEIVPPKYEEVEVDYSETELEKYSIGNGEYQFQKREPHFKFIMKQEDLSKFTTVKDPVGYMYCIVEVPSEFFTLSKEKLKTRGYKLSKTKIINQSRIIKRFVKKKPKKLNENQYYFKSGFWTKPKKAIATSF